MSSSSAGTPARRGLRDRPLGRVAILVAVLVAALLVSRGCGSSGDVDKDRAVAIALQQVDFTPECKQVRYVRRGIQARGFWAVSLWTLDDEGEFDRVSVVLVDAQTGAVGDVTNQPQVGATQAQCADPV